MGGSARERGWDRLAAWLGRNGWRTDATAGWRASRGRRGWHAPTAAPRTPCPRRAGSGPARTAARTYVCAARRARAPRRWPWCSPPRRPKPWACTLWGSGRRSPAPANAAELPRLPTPEVLGTPLLGTPVNNGGKKGQTSAKPGPQAYQAAFTLDATLQDTEDSQYHVGDDKYDYNDGRVLDEGSGNDPTAPRAARRRLSCLLIELIEASASTTHAPPYPQAWLAPFIIT